MQDTNLQPLLDMKQRLEQLLAEKLNAAAVLRKKIEAIEMALNVMRSTDDELRQLPANGAQPRKTRVYLDENLATVAIIEIMEKAGKPIPVRDIVHGLKMQGMDTSDYAVKKILKRDTRFVTLGQRDRTTYGLGKV